MIVDLDLLNYSKKLVQLEVERQELQKELIVQKANLQDFESNLFKVCVVDFYKEVTFFQTRDQLLEKLSDDTYCDTVYSEISKSTITFFDYNHDKLLQIDFEDEYCDYTTIEL